MRERLINMYWPEYRIDLKDVQRYHPLELTVFHESHVYLNWNDIQHIFGDNVQSDTRDREMYHIVIPEMKTATIRKGIIDLSNGWIADSNCRIIKESAVKGSERSFLRCYSALKTKKPIYMSGIITTIMNPFEPIYGHFLITILPRLYALSRAGYYLKCLIPYDIDLIYIKHS